MTFSDMLNTLHPAPVLSRAATPGAFRQMAESLVLLAVAVVIFRGFAAEGYLISTGSMAPTLLGYHHDVVCPECEFSFAHGAPVDESESTVATAWADYEIGRPMIPSARCPNCGFNGMPVEKLPRTEGDQLLVHKHAYEFREPRRWEVIVFRNPGDARQAYVKRVVGLPEESIQIVNGDVYANGQLARKPYSVQQAVKIPVSDYSRHVPSDDPDCRSAWVRISEQSRWQTEPTSLRYELSADAEIQPIDWIGFRHWIRSGGKHLTRVDLPQWPADLRPLDSTSSSPLHFQDGQLQSTGVMTDIERRAWLSRSDDPDFHRAINELSEQSHTAPLTDEYGYNSPEGVENHPLNEFLISLTLSNVVGTGRFEMELSDGEQIFSVVFRFDKRIVELLRNSDPVPLRSKAFEAELLNSPVQIDFSLIDDQAVLAVNGQEFLEPYQYAGSQEALPMLRPVRFGVTGIGCEVTNLGLFRDLYYTSKGQAEEVSQEPWQLDRDEFFVLGDNSPVSVDSRVWEDPAVPRSALIGKPLVVHLPSSVRRMIWGGESHNVRVPDFSRVRLVR